MLKNKKQHSKKGQSLLEFALLMPVLIMMLQIVIEVEGAISTSIVNQKYTRSSMHWFMFNHRNYMQLSWLKLEKGGLMRRFWIGVDDKINFGSDNPVIKPVAPIRKIGTAKATSDDTGQSEYPEVTERQNVRVRSVAFTCLPPASVNGIRLLAEQGMEETTFQSKYPYCSE